MTDEAGGMAAEEKGHGLRLDRYLWFARFFKSRSAATALCAAGRVRVNREPGRKASSLVCTGDVLTFPQGNRIRVVRVVALGSRRGPPAEARTLYEDLASEGSEAAPQLSSR